MCSVQLYFSIGYCILIIYNKNILKIIFLQSLKANVSKMRTEPHLQFLFKVNQLNPVQTKGGGYSSLKPTISSVRVYCKYLQNTPKA